MSAVHPQAGPWDARLKLTSVFFSVGVMKACFKADTGCEARDGIHLGHGSNKSFMVQEEVFNGCQCFQMVGRALYVLPENRAPGFQQLRGKRGGDGGNVSYSLVCPHS